MPVTVDRQCPELGFPAAINQGLRAARGEYLVLLNNDAVVTDGWLDQLIALDRGSSRTADAEDAETRRSRNAIARSPKADVSGTRRRGGRSPAKPVRHRRSTLARSAWSGRCRITPRRRSWSRTCPIATWTRCTPSPGGGATSTAGKWFTVPKLSGFCLLMTRAVYEPIGGLDERFGLGFFDDDDLAERARRAGFELAVAHDLFVHHFGSRTFAGNGIDAEALLAENERRFAAKWGHDDAPRPAGRAAAVGWEPRILRAETQRAGTKRQSRSPSPDTTRIIAEPISAITPRSLGSAPLRTRRIRTVRTSLTDHDRPGRGG